MGIFDKFKNKPKAKITFTQTTFNNSYDPWKGTNSNTDFSNVNFLDWANKKQLGLTNDDYPRYMSYSYDIHQPLKKHKQFIKDGYLVQGSIEDSLALLKSQELKDILSKNNLSTTGKKAVLLQRIMDNVDIKTINIRPIYILSSSGLDYLTQYGYYLDLPQYILNGDISLQEYDQIKAKQPYLSTSDIMWQIYNKKSIDYLKKGDYSLARNIELSRYNILVKENKLKDASYHLIAILYYDLSGMGNNNTVLPFEDIMIAPGLISELREQVENINDDIIDKCYKIYVPFHYFDKSVFKQILSDMLIADIDINDYKKFAKKPK